MKNKDEKAYFGGSIINGMKSIGSVFTRKLGADLARCLAFVMVLIVLGSIVFGVHFALTKWYDYQVDNAMEEYTVNNLDDSHFKAKKLYKSRYYEECILEFAEYIEKFPSILYTKDDQNPEVEKSTRVDEAIIKVVLSLRKLNRNDEIFNHVRNFKKKFPKSKLVYENESNKIPIINWYQSGLMALYDVRRLYLTMVEMVGGSQYESVYRKWRRTEELSESVHKTFGNARKSFENLLTYNLLNDAPYSELKGESLYLIAKSFLIEGEYKRAYQEFDKITTRVFSNYPDLQEEAMYYAAYCLIQRGVYEEALGRYTEFMTESPNSEYVTDAYFDIGMIYAARKEYDNARGSFESALQRSKDKSRKVELQLGKGRDSYVSGNQAKAGGKVKEAQIEYEKAIRIYKRLSVEYPEDSFLLEVINFFSELPRNPEDWNEEIEGQIAEFERFVKKYGQERDARFQAAIGRAYYDEGIDDDKLENDAESRGAYNEAIAAYKVLLDEYPQSSPAPRTKLLIANIYNKLNEHSESIQAYTRILDDYETDYGIEKETISVTNKEVPKVTDLRAFCVYEIAVAHHEMRNYEKALEWYQKILGENGFKHNDTANAVDLRQDSLGPDALYDAMRALDALGQDEELKNLATTYIEDLRKDAPLLSAEAQFNFAHIKYVNLKQSGGVVQVAREFKKLGEKFAVNENGDISGYLPDPDLRFNLIRLHGKYYEGLCYEYSDGDAVSMDDLNADMDGLLFSTEAYHEVTTLFKTTFQPLINAPNIDVPNRDYYITEATKIFEDLVNRHPIGKYAAYWQYLVGEFYYAKKDFEKAIVEYQKVLKNNPVSDYSKNVSDRIKEIREKLGSAANEKMDSSKVQDNSGSSENAQAENYLTPEQIAKRASNATVYLGMNYTSTGSGFFVGPGLIATNFHVIEGATFGYAHLMSKDLTYAIAGVVATDEERDLAILKVRAYDVPLLPLGNSDNVQVGETVYAAGSPKGWKDTVSMGIISRVHPVTTNIFRSGQKVVAKRIQITAPTSPGSSGGPILNSKGKVIAINHAGLHSPDAQNLNLAIPVNYLERLLKRVGIPEPLENFKVTSR